MGFHLHLISQCKVLLVLLPLVLSSYRCSAQNVSLYYIKPTNDTPCPPTLTPDTACFTLNQIAQHPAYLTASNTTLLFLPGHHNLSSSITVTNVARFAMSGILSGAASRIECTQPASFNFVNISVVQISGLEFLSCGASGPSLVAATVRCYNAITKTDGCYKVTNITHSMTVYRSNLVVNDTSFERNPGGAIEAINSNATFRNNTFLRNNLRAITSDHSTLSFTGPHTFKNNGNSDTHGGAICACNNSALSTTGNTHFVNNFSHRGGGIYALSSNVSLAGENIFVRNYASWESGALWVMNGYGTQSGNAVFESNYAQYWGGAFFVELYIWVSTGNISFVNNSVGQSGGAIWAAYSTLIMAGNTTFTNNTAGLLFGGAICATLFTSVAIVGTTSSFSNNSAQYYGGAIFNDHRSSFAVTGRSTFSNNTALYGGAICNCDSSLLTINGTITFVNNSAHVSGGAVCMLQGGNIYFNGKVDFTENSADDGGAIALSDAKCYFADDTNVTFLSNNARQNGGAISVKTLTSCPVKIDPNTYHYYFSKSDCFFQVSSPNANLSTIKLSFKSNHAVNAGSALYQGIIDYCNVELIGESSGDIFDKLTTFKDESKLSPISSDPLHVCPCDNGQPNCSKSAIIHSIYPGQKITLSLVAVGQRNGTISTTIQSYFGADSAATFGPLENAQTANNTCSNLHYTVYSTAKFENITILTNGPCKELETPLAVNVKLLPCPRGFAMSPTTAACDCAKRLQKYTNTCNINDQTIFRKGDFWVGYDQSSVGGGGLILHPHCPFDYCTTRPLHFTVNDTDLQCAPNRTGLLCGACQPGLSLVLGSSKCLPCSNWYLTLLFPFAIAGIALVAFLLTFKLTVAAGTISGLIFYANIVATNQAIFFPSGQTNVFTIFIAWINLDLGIETCFYHEMDAYGKTWLQFLFPIYIWLLMALIIYVSNTFPKISRMLGKNPVAVLATLVLLSYTKILSTAMAALSFTTLEYPNTPQLVWLYDGNVRYLHDATRIYLFATALLFFIPLILYTLLLIFSQWLRTRSNRKPLSWTNNSKLKGFLDAYHAPFKPPHHYWTGLLFVLRVVLSLIHNCNVLGDPSLNLLAISAVSLLLLMWVWFTPNGPSSTVYRKWYLNALEASFILNLGMLAAATYYVKVAGGSQDAVAYSSVSVAIVTFIGIVVYHIYLQVYKAKGWKAIVAKIRHQEKTEQGANNIIPEVDSGDQPLIPPSVSFLQVSYGTHYREPLLDSRQSESSLQETN